MSAFAVAIAVPFLVGAALAPADADRDVVFRFADPAIVESSGLAAAGGLVTTVNDSGDSAPGLHRRRPHRDGPSASPPGTASATDVEALAPAGDGEVLGRRHRRQRRRPRRGDGDPGAGRPRRPVGGGGVVPARLSPAARSTPRRCSPTRGPAGCSWSPRASSAARCTPRRPRSGRTPPTGCGCSGTRRASSPTGRSSPTAGTCVLRNYGRAFVLAFPSLELVGGFDLPAQKQGEGIAVAPDGTVYASSEGVRSPVLRIAVPDEIAEAMAAPAGWARPAPGSSGSDDGTAGANGAERLDRRLRRPRCRPPRRQRAPAQRLALARRLPVPRHRPGRPDPRPPPPLTSPLSRDSPKRFCRFPEPTSVEAIRGP